MRMFVILLPVACVAALLTGCSSAAVSESTRGPAACARYAGPNPSMADVVAAEREKLARLRSAAEDFHAPRAPDDEPISAEQIIASTYDAAMSAVVDDAPAGGFEAASTALCEHQHHTDTERSVGSSAADLPDATYDAAGYLARILLIDAELPLAALTGSLALCRTASSSGTGLDNRSSDAGVVAASEKICPQFVR